MKITETKLKGLFVIEPKVFGDERGFFMETYRVDAFREAGIPTNFVQDNLSRSVKGTLRGLHFQTGDHAQGKLVRVTLGSVLDVAVDLRADSPTFGQHVAFELSAENKKSLYIPVGFGHGFCVTSESADFQYKCTAFYAPQADSGVRWNDPDLAIEWPVTKPIISAKDSVLPSFRDYKAKPAFVMRS